MPRTSAGASSSLPTPRTSDRRGAGRHGQGGPDLRTALIPTPVARDRKGQDLPTREGGQGIRNALLPTPAVVDMGSHYTDHEWATWVAVLAERHGNDGHGRSLTQEARAPARYAPAIAHWEQILKRPAPPILTGGHVNAWFVEWMMGMPLGHVCAVPGLSWVTATEALGRGVVPQQAQAAFSRLNRLRNLILDP